MMDVPLCPSPLTYFPEVRSHPFVVRAADILN